MPNLFKSSCTGSNPNGQESSHPIFAPENASLAQGLLRTILENARIEEFSPEGGGIVLMRLDRWQIDLLEIYGLMFEQFSTTSKNAQLIKSGKTDQDPKYITFNRDMSNSSILSPDKYRSTNILSEWLAVK